MLFNRKEQEIYERMPDTIEWCYDCYRWETSEQFGNKDKRVPPPLVIRIGRFIAKPIGWLTQKADRLSSWLSQDYDQPIPDPPDGYVQNGSIAKKSIENK